MCRKNYYKKNVPQILFDLEVQTLVKEFIQGNSSNQIVVTINKINV